MSDGRSILRKAFDEGVTAEDREREKNERDAVVAEEAWERVRSGVVVRPEGRRWHARAWHGAESFDGFGGSKAEAIEALEGRLMTFGVVL